MNNFYKWFILLLLPALVCAIEPISITAAIGAGIATYYGYDSIKDMTYCQFRECCNERSVPININGKSKHYDYSHFLLFCPHYIFLELGHRLRTNLYGQHIVVDQLLAALNSHFSKIRKSRKALVLSFHGTPGTGKNYVAQMIAESMYTLGLRSSFVHKFVGRSDFETETLVSYYKKIIFNTVKEGLSACQKSLFIFDEVEMMPPGIFEFITSILDFSSGMDSSQAVFLFLSNTAGIQISDHLGVLIKRGKLREETKLSDYERILEKTAFNADGGLKESSLIKAHVIDHFIPFLPLEKYHVHKCVEAEFRMLNMEPDHDQIE